MITRQEIAKQVEGLVSGYTAEQSNRIIFKKILVELMLINSDK
jgi:hypothetical protein